VRGSMASSHFSLDTAKAAPPKSSQLSQLIPMPTDPPFQHLIVAWYEGKSPGQRAVYLLRKVIRSLGADGSFSVVINRQSGQSVHCAFEIKEDADRLAGAMKARRIEKYPGWKSQRGFSLDEAYDVAKDLVDRSPRRRSGRGPHAPLTRPICP